MSEKTPKIKKEDGFTTIDAVINCHKGIAMRTARSLVEEATRYKNKIYFLNNNEQDQYDAKRILDLVMIDIEKDPKIKVMVEGNDEIAKKIALRFFSALSSKNSYELDFDRYDGINAF
ncbi:HPr family phosphocarrier protein [Candidatus Woesearchaeota archaeon]|nr:HPr family phosphocarrier protein [Candidatus Woesearchaeota archaeon]